MNLPRATITHNFALTERRVFFLDLPVHSSEAMQ